MADLAPRTAKEYVVQRYEKGIHTKKGKRFARKQCIEEMAVAKTLATPIKFPGPEHWLTVSWALNLDQAGTVLHKCERKWPDRKFRIYRPHRSWMTTIRRGRGRIGRAKILQRELS